MKEYYFNFTKSKNPTWDFFTFIKLYKWYQIAQSITIWEITASSLSQPNVAFHIETSHLFCFAKQVTGFYMKRNTGLKWVKWTFSDII